MKKLLYLLIVMPFLASSNFAYKISFITPKIKQKMIKGNSYRAGCPVGLSSLRYLTLTYIGFDGKEHTGELIVNKSVAKDFISIFRELYNIKYPIRKMKLVSNYHGNDFISIEADNTSAFNCRFINGTNRWSKHSFGKAIDINPIENPFVTKSGHTSHKASKKYLKRVKTDKTVILSGDRVVKFFQKYGFRWGGYFNSYKDYQHFAK